MRKTGKKIILVIAVMFLGICLGKGTTVNAKSYEKSDFTGVTWYGIDTGYTLEFNDNTLTSTEGNVSRYLSWAIKGDKIITVGVNTSEEAFQIVEDGGNIQLVGLIKNQSWNNIDTYVTKENIPMEQLSVNDTASTDLLELTLKDFYFQDELPVEFNPYRTEGSIKADNGMTFFCADIHVKNISKEEMQFKSFGEGSEYCDYVLNYNDGYEFTTMGESQCYCCASNEDEGYQFTNKSSTGYSPKAAPLTEIDITVAIPCAAMVAQDTNAPLNLIATLPTSSGTAKFNYNLTGMQK